MKTSLRKFLTFVMVLFVAFVGFIGAAKVNAAEETIDWTKASYASASSSAVVWNGTNFTITLAKDSSSTNANNYLGGTNAHTRIYKGQKLTFAPATGYQIDKIVITATSGTYAGYFTSTWANATASVSGSTVTVIPTEKTTAAVLTIGTATRATKIVVTTSAPSAPSVSINGDNYTEIDDVVTLTAETANVEGSLVWSSSNDSVATVDQEGNVTAKSMGKATITAEVNGTKGTLEFTVYPTDGSELTIAEALQVCEWTGETNCAFTYSTTGVIESIDTAYNSGYNNITVTITDGTDSIKAYRMVGGSELVEGDKIKVTGILVNYNGNTPEFIAGCTYIAVQDDATVEAAKATINAIEAFMSLSYQYTRDIQEVESTETKEVVFDFGANGTASHTDGSDMGASKSYTVDGYTLSLTSASKVYASARDAKGNSCLKLGTSSAAGKFSFTVPEDVVKVDILVAGYKANTAKITVNSTSQTISTTSNNGEYTTVSVDTSSEKTITFTTVSGGYRCMINTIKFYAEASSETTTESVEVLSNGEFRIRFGVNASIAEFENNALIEEFGIKVSANGKTVNYTNLTATAEGDVLYVVVSLGDLFEDEGRFAVEFTAEAYIVIDGVTYTSDADHAKVYSVASMVKEYNEQGLAVTNLYDYLVGKGYIK